MNRLRASMLGALLTLAALAAGVGSAQAVAVSVGAGSGLAGQTVDIDINTASLTGLNVTSLQFDLTYSSAQVTAVNVITPGSLTAAAGWVTPAFSVLNANGTGTLHVSDAGTAPIVGAGSLLKIRFTLNPALLNGGGSTLSLANFKFNEGSLVVTTTTAYLAIGTTPQIFISPPSGEIIRGQTLQFSVGGTPTLPVGYTTSNNAIATISGTGLLTGVAPGAVTVTATDAAAHSSTTSGQVLVRGMGITAGSGGVVAGNPISVPVTVTSLAGLAIRSGQFELTYNRAVLSLASVTTPAGTLLNGYGSMTYAEKSTGCVVGFYGTTDLTGTGVLCYLNFTTSAASPGGTYLQFASAVFNETLPALGTYGYVTASALPLIYVNPDVQSLLAGQTQQYTVSGSPTAPITWSVANPAIASISPTGLVTALSGGVTQVRAQDAVGAVDYSTSLTVYDLQVTLGHAVGGPGATVSIPITSDRLVGGLNIRSMQFKVVWAGTPIVDGSTSSSGLWGGWGPGNNVSKFNYGLANLSCAGAGSAAMANTGTLLATISLAISPSATPGTTIPLTLAGLTFNEGLPKPLVLNGQVLVSTAAGVPPTPGTAEFALGSSEPNPAHGNTRIPFSLPSATAGGAQAKLGVYDLTGRRVRVLVDSVLGAGLHEAMWDGRDDSGRVLAPGLYFTRLDWAGRVATRRLTLVD
jgi:hypothetical protein